MGYVVLVALILWVIVKLGSKKKVKHRKSVQNVQPKIALPNKETIASGTPYSKTPFPDRRDMIVHHTRAVEDAKKRGDLEFANLSYAKLIESIRQQNINTKGEYDKILSDTTEEYKHFRQKYGLEYPKEFLPYSERKQPDKKQKFGPAADTLIYIETLNYNDLPKSILQNVDIVRSIEQWNRIGFKPHYKNEFEEWNDIKRENRYFDYSEAFIGNKLHKVSYETGRRITKNPYYIKALIDQGCKPDEFLNWDNDLPHFINAVNLEQEGNNAEANLEVEAALSIRKRDDSLELQNKVQIKLGNTEIAGNEFEKYKDDLDSPVHTGEIFNWIRAFVIKKEYAKTLDYIKQTDSTLDNLKKGFIKPKIYGTQSPDWYDAKQKEFHERIYQIFTDVHDFEKGEPFDSLVVGFENFYTGNYYKPFENLGDIYAGWINVQAAEKLYQKSLYLLANEERPRVKARLQKKIDNLKNRSV